MNSLIKSSIAKRTLRLIDLAWLKYAGTLKVCELTNDKYRKCYELVCYRVALACARLRRIGGFKFCYSVVGDDMAEKTLYALCRE